MAQTEQRTIKDLSPDELKALIATTVREAIEDEMEDLLALKSTQYLESITEARKDFKEGRTQKMSELSSHA